MANATNSMAGTLNAWNKYVARNSAEFSIACLKRKLNVEEQ